LAEAQGEAVAFFDDDDYYAPSYLEHMLDKLGESDVVKLAGWFALSVPDQAFFYWDTAANHPLHYKVGEGAVGLVTSAQFKPDFVARNVDGYGFSYLFRRAVGETARFPGQSFGEDLAFMTALRSAGRTITHLQDGVGLVVHVIHARNTSVIFPQYRLPFPLAERLFPGLDRYLTAVRA
jgi:hypothetical protein